MGGGMGFFRRKTGKEVHVVPILHPDPRPPPPEHGHSPAAVRMAQDTH